MLSTHSGRADKTTTYIEIVNYYKDQGVTLYIVELDSESKANCDDVSCMTAGRNRSYKIAR